MAFYSFKVGPYARSIYLDGAITFESLEASYQLPIKQRAAKDFTYPQIDAALSKGYINQDQYDETIALKTLLMPRPVTTAAAEEPAAI
jgi:hypothetical protein